MADITFGQQTAIDVYVKDHEYDDWEIFVNDMKDKSDNITLRFPSELTYAQTLAEIISLVTEIDGNAEGIREELSDALSESVADYECLLAAIQAAHDSPDNLYLCAELARLIDR